MNKINMAVIGYGGMGAGFHARRARTSDVVTLRGVYDILPERRAAAEREGIAVYPDLEAVLTDEQVELVTVAIPNQAHHKVVIRALQAGKHVICEKPVALNSGELRDMIDTANRHHRIFTVHQNRRWDVDFLAMKQLVSSGEIGEIIGVESRINGSRGIPGDWRRLPECGGGMLYDWGVHLIDQAMLLIPETVVGIHCRFDHITETDVDDGFHLTMTYDSGKTAFIEVGTYNFLPLPRFYLRGRQGTALLRDWQEETQVVKCRYWHESDVLPVQTAAGLTKTMAPRDEVTTSRYTVPQPAADVHDFYRNVCGAIAGKEPQLVTHEQMIRVIQVMEACFCSAQSGQAVSCRI